MVRFLAPAAGGCTCLFGQNAAMVRAAAHEFAAQSIGPALSEEQRNEAARLRQQAEQDTQAHRYGEALRNYAHATAIVRHARWTPAAELAASVELRVEHVLLEPRQPVTLSLGRLYPVTPSEEAKLTASVRLAPAAKPEQPSNELIRTVALDPARIPYSAQVQIPEIALGNYDLAVHLTPANAPVPEMLEDVFTKIMPVHIKKLEAEAAALQRTLAAATAKNAAALATVEYVLGFTSAPTAARKACGGLDGIPSVRSLASQRHPRRSRTRPRSFRRPARRFSPRVSLGGRSDTAAISLVRPQLLRWRHTRAAGDRVARRRGATRTIS